MKHGLETLHAFFMNDNKKRTAFDHSTFHLKRSILLGSTLFTVHLCSFFYVHYVPYYVTAAGIGIGHVRE